jgi:hypothetical protein
MLELDTTKTAPPIAREPLFAINGKAYSIPVRFLPTDMLTYLHIITTSGGDAAANWGLHHALGEEGYWALIDAGAALDESDLKAMIDCVTGRLLGMNTPVPGPKDVPDAGPAPETGSTEEPPDEDVWPEATSGEAAQG